MDLVQSIVGNCHCENVRHGIFIKDHLGLKLTLVQDITTDVTGFSQEATSRGLPDDSSNGASSSPPTLHGTIV